MSTVKDPCRPLLTVAHVRSSHNYFIFQTVLLQRGGGGVVPEPFYRLRLLRCEPLSKLLVSPLITPITVPYIIPHISPL